MSIRTEVNRVQYLGNGSTTNAYSIPFYFSEKTDLKVVATDEAGNDIPLTLITDYIITGEENPSGGHLRTTTPWHSTHKITIYREVSATQTTVYEENAEFPAKSHERALDKLTMLVQQLGRKLSLSFRLRESDGQIQEAPKVANSVFGLGADGHPAFRTATDLASWLNLTQEFFDSPTKTFADAGERAISIPGFSGQLGSQRDNGSIWIAGSTSAGNWAPYVPAENSILLAMLSEGILENSTNGRSRMADGFLSADSAGRAKMANGFLTLGKIATGIFTADTFGRAPFSEGFINSDLLASNAAIMNLPSGAVIQTQSESFTTYISTTAVIATNDTIPQNTQGVQLLTCTISPKFSSSKIRIRFHGYYGCPDSTPAVSTAVFVNSELNAIHTTSWYQSNSGSLCTNSLETEHTPGSTAAQTYAIRIGTTAGTVRVNGNPTSRLFGGTSRCYLVVEEIKA